MDMIKMKNMKSEIQKIMSITLITKIKVQTMIEELMELTKKLAA